MLSMPAVAKNEAKCSDTELAPEVQVLRHDDAALGRRHASQFLVREATPCVLTRVPHVEAGSMKLLGHGHGDGLIHEKAQGTLPR